MFKYHTTQDGERMMICEMDDSHLINTIYLLLRNHKEQMQQTTTSTMNEYERKLYKVKPTSPEKLAELTTAIAECIAPYVLEANLRGLGDRITKQLQESFSRDHLVILPQKRKFMDDGISLFLNDTNYPTNWDDDIDE